jgi:phage/plasmid-like protein (TIGR03299 family)
METETLISLDERVGTDVSSASSYEDVLNIAGFNFNIDLVPMHTPEGNIVKNNYIIRRDDSKRILGTCKSRYSPVQNEEMFKPFHEMVDRYGAEYETAGLISGGSKCWISAKLPGDYVLKNRPDDKMERRMICLISHDGTKRNSYLTIVKRVFCNNMLSLLTKEGSKQGHSISHTKNWQDNLEVIQNSFEDSIIAHNHFETVANKLDDIVIDANQVKVFTEMLLPDTPAERDMKGKIIEKRTTSRIDNRRDHILDLFITGAGNRGKSRWDAFNAVTEYVDHHNNIKRLDGKNGVAAAERRFISSVIDGPGNNLKRKALNLLINSKKDIFVKSS